MLGDDIPPLQESRFIRHIRLCRMSFSIWKCILMRVRYIVRF